MENKRKAVLLVGVIIGFMIVSNVVFYNLGQNNPHPIEGYRLREYSEEMTVWASEQIVDGLIIQGDSVHPARFTYEISSPSALSFKVFSQRGELLYKVSNESYVFYEHELTTPQEFFIVWSVIQTDSESDWFASILQYNVAIWEWIVLEPLTMEGVV